MPEVRVYPDPAQTAATCAAQIIEWLSEAIRLRGTATLAISGGTSPRSMFGIFAATELPWQNVHLFWVDERAVPPDHPDSNYKLAKDAWLDRAPEPPVVHRIYAELPPAIAAERYAKEIRDVLEAPTAATSGAALPTLGEIHFDVIHRGMGPDSHTASLFPGEPLIDDRSGIVASVWVEKFHQWRITLLPGVLERARHTAMLVTGADKTEALLAVLNGPINLRAHPAQIAATSSVWFVDAAAFGAE